MATTSHAASSTDAAVENAAPTTDELLRLLRTGVGDSPCPSVCLLLSGPPQSGKRRCFIADVITRCFPKDDVLIFDPASAAIKTPSYRKHHIQYFFDAELGTVRSAIERQLSTKPEETADVRRPMLLVFTCVDEPSDWLEVHPKNTA